MGVESMMKMLLVQRSAKRQTVKKHKIPETKDPNRRFLKEMVKNFLQVDVAQIRYDTGEVMKILGQLQQMVKDEPTLIEVDAPIYVCGDIHGQLTDLRRIFYICGFPSRKKFMFLGDYVDRGAHSVEVMLALACLKLLFPANIYMLRGNHELSHINKEYGFLDEVKAKWIDPKDAEKIYDTFNDTFSYFPIAGLIAKKILCMHGGLSPFLDSLDDLRSIKRPVSATKGLVQDLLWADPLHGVVGFKPNALRSCSYNFGEQDVREKLAKLGVSKLIRAHQVVQYGWESFASGTVITVFTACRYQDDLCNYGAIIDIDKNLGISVIMVKPSDFDEIRSIAKPFQDQLTIDFSALQQKEQQEKRKELAKVNSSGAGTPSSNSSEKRDKTGKSSVKKVKKKFSQRSPGEKTQRSEKGKTDDDDEEPSKNTRKEKKTSPSGKGIKSF